jgi:hypothetical protein
MSKKRSSNSDSGFNLNLDYLKHSAPRLRFVGGPNDGKEIVWTGTLPVQKYSQEIESLSGVPVIDIYHADPTDPEMLRMVYAGRQLAMMANKPFTTAEAVGATNHESD